MSTLKETIKTMSAEQSFLKQQRKSIYFQGQRKLSPSEAAGKHLNNRQDLRQMYAAYAILRGKPELPLGGDPFLSAFEKKKIEKYVADHKAYYDQKKAEHIARQKAWEEAHS